MTEAIISTYIINKITGKLRTSLVIVFLVGGVCIKAQTQQGQVGAPVITLTLTNNLANNGFYVASNGDLFFPWQPHMSGSGGQWSPWSITPTFNVMVSQPSGLSNIVATYTNSYTSKTPPKHSSFNIGGTYKFPPPSNTATGVNLMVNRGNPNGSYPGRFHHINRPLHLLFHLAMIGGGQKPYMPTQVIGNYTISINVTYTDSAGATRTVNRQYTRQVWLGNLQQQNQQQAQIQQQTPPQQQAQTQQQNQNQTGSQQTFQQQWGLLQQQQLGTRIQGRGLTTTLSTRFNPKTGIVEVTKNGVISHRGFLNFQGKNLNRRQSLRNYR